MFLSYILVLCLLGFSLSNEIEEPLSKVTQRRAVARITTKEDVVIVNCDCKCPKGPRGEPGLHGREGYTGMKGVKGESSKCKFCPLSEDGLSRILKSKPIGIKGIAPLVGPPGIDGIPGAPGEIGEPGKRGYKGEPGNCCKALK